MKVFYLLLFVIPTSYALDASRVISELNFLKEKAVETKSLVNEITPQESVQEVAETPKTKSQMPVEDLEDKYFGDEVSTQASGLKRSR